MKYGLNGPSAFLAIIAVFTMAVAPPIGLILLVCSGLMHSNHSSKIKAAERAQAARRAQQRERVMILAFKSLP